MSFVIEPHGLKVGKGGHYIGDVVCGPNLYLGARMAFPRGANDPFANTYCHLLPQSCWLVLVVEGFMEIPRTNKYAGAVQKDLREI